jgi:hypothetical protein
MERISMPDLERRRLLGAAAAVAASQLPLLTLPRRLDAMTGAMTTTPSDVAREAVTGTADIRPFHVSVPEADLADMRRRIAATKWPERETVADSSQGVRLATMQALARHWATAYDWRKCEARLNAVPNFVTNIDGLDIHFIHVRSKHADALPLIITHGWPGSVVEQLKVIAPLTDPTAHGGSAADAFHVVVPSLPGYGFSGKPTAPGWNPVTIARAWATLMQRLGYTRYVAQGGDWGTPSRRSWRCRSRRVSSASRRTWRPPFRPTSRRRSPPSRSSRPPVSRPTSGTRGTSSRCSTARDSATPSR